jgi:hypothetical protein
MFIARDPTACRLRYITELLLLALGGSLMLGRSIRLKAKHPVK